MSPPSHFPLLFLLFATLSGAASARTIEGSVRERGTRAPIPAALVYAVEHDTEAYTDEQGAFVLSLPDGRGSVEVTVRLQSPGYVTSAELVRLPAGTNTAKVDLYLAPADEEGGVTRIRERRSAADLAAIAAALDQMRDEVARGDIGLDGDCAFHEAVTAAARNPVLTDLMATLAEAIAETRGESLSQDGRPPRSLEDHEAIADAIRRGDPAAAADAMRTHLDHVADLRLFHWDPTAEDHR